MDPNLGQAHDIDAMLQETGVAVPNALADALAALAATSGDVSFVDVPGEALTVAPDAVVDLIERATLSKLVADNARTSGVWGQVRNLLDRRVAREFVNSPAMTDAFNAYGVAFDEAAEKLTAAAPRLPGALTLEAAGHGSADSLAAWADARDACATLDHLTRRRDLLAQWGIRAGGIDPNLERASRCCVIEHRADVDAVLNADSHLVFREWVAILRAGVSLKWQALDDQVAIATRWAAEDAARDAELAARAQREGEREVEAWADLVATEQPKRRRKSRVEREAEAWSV